MNQPQNIDHYASVSDDIFVDTGATDPVYPEIYQRLKGFNLDQPMRGPAGNRSTITAVCVKSPLLCGLKDESRRPALVGLSL